MATAPAPRAGARTVYGLEMGGRSVYCASAACVHSLMSLGWKLSDSGQLMLLVQELSTGVSRPNHDPEDHFR